MNKPQFYTADGWVNAAAVYDDPATFTVCVGGRGIGKTFGILKEALDRNMKFIYLLKQHVLLLIVYLNHIYKYLHLLDVNIQVKNIVQRDYSILIHLIYQMYNSLLSSIHQK